MSVIRQFETRRCVSHRRLWLIQGLSLRSRFDVLQASVVNGFALLTSRRNAPPRPNQQTEGWQSIGRSGRYRYVQPNRPGAAVTSW